MSPAPTTPRRPARDRRPQFIRPAGPRAALAAVVPARSYGPVGLLGLLGLFAALVVAASGCELFLSQDGNPGHPCLPGNDCRQGKCINGICSTAGADCSADADCDDGLACNGAESCAAGSCRPGQPVDCDDGLECTEDKCQEPAGGCDHPVRQGHCLIGGQCHAAGAAHPDLPCLACAPANDRLDWSPAPDGSDCDDGDACTMNDTCHQGGCVGLPRDADEDGHVDAACPQFGVLADDCNDQSAAAHPGLAEEPAKDNCDDGLDNDCDGLTDGADPACGCHDHDGDGYLDQACGGLDCDDDDASAHPTAREDSATDPDTCADGIDNDCDGQTDADDSGCAARICSPDGWCWENPLPQGNDLLDVWIAPGGDAWAVGAAGSVLHAHLDDGFRTWWREPTPTEVPLTAVWGADDHHVWAVGVEGTVLFYDGTGWVRENSGSQALLTDVFGFGPGDVWVVGQDGTLLRRLGDGVWRPVPLPLDSGALPPECDGFQAIWSGEPSEIWIAVKPPPAGSSVRCNLLRLEPGRAELLDAAGCGDINALWGSGGRDDIFAAAADGTVCRLERGEWTRDRQPEQGMEHTLHALGGTGPDDVWAVGNTDGEPQRQILVHRGAQGWELPEDEPLPGLHGVFFHSAERGLAVGLAGGLVDWDRSDWYNLFDPLTTADLRACHGVAGSFWTVGQGGVVLERDLAQGEWYPRSPDGADPLHAVWVLSAGDVWVVGGRDDGLALHRSDDSWAQLETGATKPLRGVWAAASDSVYLVGDDGQRLYYDGSDYTASPSGGPSPAWQAVFGWEGNAGDEPVRAVGFDVPGEAEALVCAHIADAWGGVDSWGAGALYSVWGTRDSDFWAVGAGGGIWHHQNEEQTRIAIGAVADRKLTAIHGRGTAVNQAWIAGSGGAVLRRTPNGADAWALEQTGTSNWLNGIWLQPDEARVWAVGNKGTVLSREIH